MSQDLESLLMEPPQQNATASTGLNNGGRVEPDQSQGPPPVLFSSETVQRMLFEQNQRLQNDFMARWQQGQPTYGAARRRSGPFGTAHPAVAPQAQMVLLLPASAVLSGSGSTVVSYSLRGLDEGEFDADQLL